MIQETSTSTFGIEYCKSCYVYPVISILVCEALQLKGSVGHVVRVFPSDERVQAACWSCEIHHSLYVLFVFWSHLCTSLCLHTEFLCFWSLLLFQTASKGPNGVLQFAFLCILIVSATSPAFTSRLTADVSSHGTVHCYQSLSFHSRYGWNVRWVEVSLRLPSIIQFESWIRDILSWGRDILSSWSWGPSLRRLRQTPHGATYYCGLVCWYITTLYVMVFITICIVFKHIFFYQGGRGWLYS